VNNPTVASPSSADAARLTPAADARRVVVEAWRGQGVESRHDVWCAVVPAGSLGAGPAPGLAPVPALPHTFMRSAAKPFQLLPLVAAGGVERFALDAADLAVMAASHDGTDAHAARVAAILSRMGLGADVLRCGTQRPYFLDGLPPEHAERLRLFGPLHNNCSGNHAALLGLALVCGVDPKDYLDPASASQVRAHTAVEALCGVTAELAVDDCGAPCYGVPLAAMARAYLHLAAPAAVLELPAASRQRLESVGGAGLVSAALQQVAAAMAREPEWVSGATSGATRLARQLPDQIVAKYGAEGILCVAHRGRGQAVALKVADGQARALMPALLAVARALAWLPAAADAALADVDAPLLFGRVGQVVGRLRVAP
jgi:L-asparaginase II